MADPIEPQHLLDQAWEIALAVDPAGGGRGTDFAAVFESITQGVRGPLTTADCRRAVSSAYYGLFHALTLASVSLFAPAGDARYELVRWIRHADLKKVTAWVQGEKPPDGLETSVAVLRDDEQVRKMAAAFQRLVTARENADYNHFSTFEQSDVLDYVRNAQEAVDLLPDGGSFDHPPADGGDDPGDQLAGGPRRDPGFAVSAAGRLFLGLIALRARGGGG